MLGDEHGLRQVATNLVANALQHTPDDARVTVRVGRLAARRPPAPSRVRVRRRPPCRPALPLAVLEVADTGPGCRAAHAPRVFERLYRADPSRTRGNGGGPGSACPSSRRSCRRTAAGSSCDAPRGGGRDFRVLLPADRQ